MHRTGLKAALSMVLLAVSSFAAHAEEEERDTGVLGRERPEYDAPGVPMGAFTLYPSLSVAVGTDDNVFATETAQVDDFFGSVNPAAILKSNWSRHKLELDAHALATTFNENPDEDQFEWGVGGKGHLDLTNSSVLRADVHFNRIGEERGSIDASSLAAEPTHYNMATGSLGFTHKVNRFSFGVSGRVTSFDYDDPAQIGGGLVDQDFRDKTVTETTATFKYDLSPGFRAVVQGKMNERDYDLEPTDPGFVVGVDFNRDSTGYSVAGGVEFEVTSLVNGSVTLGHMQQEYDDVSFDTLDGVSFAADLKWSLSGMTDLRVQGGRTAEDSLSSTSGGRLATQVGAAIDHELLRNVIATVEGSHTNYEFEGNLREEELVRAGAGFKYLVHRNVALGLGYQFVDRTSNVVGLDHARHVVQLNFRLQL